MIKFVGAGPGAIDLITIRGLKALESADVVIYAGSLVNKDLLAYCRVNCEIYDSATMTLEEVISVMVDSSALNKNIVRLHTGDPSIYGAIKEQMDKLDALGIDYEVVPGVSSFLAAAATLRKEFTLPSVSQTVILTRIAGRTPVPPLESIRSLASHNASMAIFLSLSLIDDLVAELLAGGYSPKTPAAIVYKASWDDEQTFSTTVEELPKVAKDNNIKKTALIFVGSFLDTTYDRSMLYHPEFTHEFRKGNK